MAVNMSFETFEELVNRAIDEVPDELVSMIDNCIVMIEPEPPADAPGLLGLYVGIPLTERNSAYSMTLPDRIYIYMNSILEMCHSYAEVVEQVRITVAHEIAHHFGISDARLHDLGYG